MLNAFLDMMVSATLKSYAAGAYVKGEWVPAGTPTQTTIQMIPLQPLKSNDLNMLSEGEIASDWRVTWIDEAYTVNTRIGNSEACEIVYGGKTYKVMQVNDRTELGNFRKVFLRDKAGA